jgi:hypothetical protein
MNDCECVTRRDFILVSALKLLLLCLNLVAVIAAGFVLIDTNRMVYNYMMTSPIEEIVKETKPYLSTAKEKQE